MLTAAGILQAPQFIYRLERGDRDTEEDTFLPLSDWEMASRLSYFLWDSMPDAQLFEAAANGELSHSDGIRTQVQRMLQDPKAHDALVDFHHQWLGTGDIHGISPDRSAYGPLYGLDPDPKLDTTGDEDWPAILGPVRHSMEAEVHLYVRDVVFEGEGTIQALFTAEKGWMSVYTAPLYGDVERLEGSPEKWRYSNVQASLGVEGQLTLNPIAFPPGQRAGLLTLPAVLAVGAYTIHPAPILRGRAVLERITCTDLGNPPQGADASTPPDTLDAESTNGERTEVATSPAECIGCHEVLNPPGFAFEHYDAMGAWRDQDNGQPVDATGNFTVQGETFSFADGLTLGEQLSQSPLVRDCYSLHWARYASGEHLDQDDERLVEFQEAFRTDGDILGLLEEIAVSPLFRNLWHEEVSP